MRLSGTPLPHCKIVEESIGVDLSVPVALVILGGALFVLWRSGRKGISDASPEEDMRMAALGCLVSLLTARLAWLHYYLLAIIPILYLLRPAAQAVGTDGEGRRLVMNAFAFAAAVMVAFNSGRIPPALRPETATLAFTTTAGALLLLILILLDFPLRRTADH